MPLTEKKSAKGELRREAILTEARGMLLGEGYQNLSLRRIAAALNISIGNLQYYFSSKDDLVETLLTREIDASLDIMHGVKWDPTNVVSSTKTVVRTLLHHYAGEAGRFYTIAESLALHDPRFAQLKAGGYAHVFREVESLVGVLVPSLDLDRRQSLTRVLVALIDGASLQVQFGEIEVPLDAVERLAEDVATALLHLTENWS